MKTKVINIYTGLPLEHGPHIKTGDMTILSNGDGYVFYGEGWHHMHVKGDDRDVLRKDAGQESPTERDEDYERAMRGM